MRYPVAEKFHAPQGEGLFTGVQMAFVRLVGCSVGQKVCTHCDTDFDRTYPELGGGMYTPGELLDWCAPCERMVLTGGEPLDRDLRPLIAEAGRRGVTCHVETSGTTRPPWLDPKRDPSHRQGMHAIGLDNPQPGQPMTYRWTGLWLTVSPKPGYLPEMIQAADEIKVILGGLGDGPGWPTVADALAWADDGKELVYVQPRNDRLAINGPNMGVVLAVVARHPRLRVSCQLHKYLRTR
jgi:hypothetical protein